MDFIKKSFRIIAGSLLLGLGALHTIASDKAQEEEDTMQQPLAAITAPESNQEQSSPDLMVELPKAPEESAPEASESCILN